jgi:hypothetical protein
MGSIYLLALALVYRCTVGGVTTYSDRPCAPEAVPYQPDTSRVSTYEPPPLGRTTPAEPPRKSPTRKRAAAGADQVRRDAACERIRNSLREVAARMRAGYDAKQGERLRQRKATLERERRAQKCR